eukprot:CAMPEP_0202897002 /NCGR_PEP_ID=MMETSP1392-20130828/5876_1 /ASSEMBLY_ACC=CAM_ASM_000868 /TAXON_ID=225041 /ORGANISM="Chlamydomonas chlamydogama, Strain SAG 11-48b" /LENGTH=434 /DNA_ID=CAMNT_0049582539 /DNA_START=419 /DNA_END=1723 /DNA_ORIENTATION=-
MPAQSATGSCGSTSTFYKRQLPTLAIEFASIEGRALFSEALQGGTMNGFFKLMEQFSTQDEPAFCGLSSLSMVLNALSIDPGRPWKGPWRWFHDELLDCCVPLEHVKKEGVTLPQAACLARCNGAHCEMKHHGTFGLEEFREQVEDACRCENHHMIVSYSRKVLQQTGDGHFSPIGGYHKGRDLVLILDTARFKYPPHWVPLPLLFEAMAPADPSTGLPRGYLLLSCQPQLDSVMFSLDLSTTSKPPFTKEDMIAVAEIAASSGMSAAEVVSELVTELPMEQAADFIITRQDSAESQESSCVVSRKREQLLAEMRALPLYQAVCDSLSASPSSSPSQPGTSLLAERASLLLLMQPPSAWPSGEQDWAGSAERAQQWAALVDLSGSSRVEAEVEFLREQMSLLEAKWVTPKLDVLCSCKRCAGGDRAKTTAALLS